MSPTRNKLLLLLSSLATLALLLVAAYRENFSRDWRLLQTRYRDQLAAPEAEAFLVQLRQVYAPRLGATDRCISCHLGMAPGEHGVAGDPVLAPHPDVVHDTNDFGCVACHGGQGRATEKDDAHGQVPHWPEPMLPQRFAYAGCGGCHTHLRVPNLDRVREGQTLVERYDCLSCHQLDGRGGTLRPGGGEVPAAPPLSRIGAGYQGSWYEKHLAKRGAADTGPWQTSFGPIESKHRTLIEHFLDSRVGAPGLVEAKATFHTLGCRGCHKVAGVGGDDGPDLTNEAAKDPGRLDFTHVAGAHTVANWLAAHFRAPAKIVPHSLMPELGLSEAEVDSLTFYMLSLRRSDYPESLWPVDRLRAERFGEREFAADGATLYGTFCAACHGRRGEGMRFPGMNAFPAIGNADFLALASDRFLAETIRHGRPGRRMPAWGNNDGGLHADEIDAIVAHLRRFVEGPAPLDVEPRRWVQGDAAEGGRLYADNCASCHGKNGEGAEGISNNRALLATADDTYLTETIRRGRRGTAMPAFATAGTTHRELASSEIESIVTFVRQWERPPAPMKETRE